MYYFDIKRYYKTIIEFKYVQFLTKYLERLIVTFIIYFFY